jgi:MoxR-like ATPase
MALDFRIDILQLPVAVVHGAWKQCHHAGQPWVDKAHAAMYLAEGIKNGQYTLADVRNAKPVPLGNPVANAMADTLQGQYQQIQQAVNPVRTVADRAAKDAVEAISRLSRALDRLDVIEQGQPVIIEAIEAIDKGLRGLALNVDKLAQIDPALVQGQVADAVRDAFKPFEAAVVAAGAQTVVGQMVSVSKIKTAPVSEVFGVGVYDTKGNEMIVDVYDNAAAPAIDPCFVWTQGILKHLLLSQSTAENLWFGGEKGTGKSETVRQFAARTGRGYCRINFHKYTTSEDYIGAVGLENGQTVFKEGDFLQAFTTPATLILLDEITNADPAALATLNGFLEPNSAVSYGGAVRSRAPNVLVFAADNTLTNGDESGRYAGTRQMNSALADRFARVVAFKHLDLADEISAVTRHTGCTEALAEHVLKAVHACRAKVTSGDIIDAPSIRQVMAFIRSVAVLGVDEAWAASIGHRQPSESATAIEAIKATYISADFISANI